jgi:hypothetical protein
MACAAGMWCSCAASCQPGKGTTSGHRPAGCVCRSAACSGHCSCQPCPSHCSAVAPSARLAAGEGGARNEPYCHILLMIIGGHGPMHVLWLCLTFALCSLHARTDRRLLSTNQLTGTLPAEWSALTVVDYMWVPCALLVRACHLAVSAAWHVRQAAGAALPPAASQARDSIRPPGQLHAFPDMLPAAAIAPAMVVRLFTPALACSSTAAQSVAHVAACIRRCTRRTWLPYHTYNGRHTPICMLWARL